MGYAKLKQFGHEFQDTPSFRGTERGVAILDAGVSLRVPKQQVSQRHLLLKECCLRTLFKSNLQEFKSVVVTGGPCVTATNQHYHGITEVVMIVSRSEVQD